MGWKDVSLSSELHVLHQAISTLCELTGHLSQSPADPGAQVLCIAASLALFEERLRLLDQVVPGRVDPMLLWCLENDAGAPFRGGGEGEGEGDVTLPACSDRKAARRHRLAWMSAERGLQRARSG